MSDKTFGQDLVGIDFNPSGNATVNRIKQKAADLIDEIKALPTEVDAIADTLVDDAVKGALVVQMLGVKAATRPGVLEASKAAEDANTEAASTDGEKSAEDTADESDGGTAQDQAA